MEQIKKYIRGNKERGHEVIAELEKLGGKNILKLKGDEYDKVYYIEIYKYTNANTIDFVSEKSFIGQLFVTHPEWEEIKLPEQFKDGDVVFYDDNIAIFKEWGDATLFRTYVTKYLCNDSLIDKNVPLFGKYIRKYTRFATEEEKEKLFQAIKENGYRWNAEKKELEKLIEPKFKAGDVIQSTHTHKYKVKITEVNVEDECYEYESMIAKGIGGIAFSEQDDWKLVPNKFDISTLVPFESRVLVRDYELHKWKPAIWGLKTDDINYPYIIVGGIPYCQCIPYEFNEHLLGTKDDCDKYYKTWEE